MSFEFSFNKSDKWSNQFSRQQSSYAYIGIFLLLLWLLTTFIQAEAGIFLTIGFLSLIVTIVSRFFAKRSQEIEVGGGVFGFLIVWLIAQYFYSKDSDVVTLLNHDFPVNDAMIGFLFALFVGWFLITEKKTSKELVFGLSPFLSSVLLNMWKLAVIIELLTLFEELESIEPFATLFFLGIGFFELVLLIGRRIKINYADLILNPLQLLATTLAGPLQAVKWILLVCVFIVLERLEVELGPVSLILAAVGIGIVCFFESLTRTTLASGVIGSAVGEGQAIVPMIFDEIYDVEAKDFRVYEVQQPLEIKKQRSIMKLPSKSLLLRLPFSSELERLGGVFLTQIQFARAKERRASRRGHRFHDRKKKRDLSIKSKSIFRITPEEWNRITNKLIQRETSSIAADLGLDNTEAVDELFQTTIQRAISVQDQIRSRFRGVPAPTDAKSLYAKIQGGSVLLPKQFLDQENLAEGEEIELIPGKDEFLFYARVRKKEREEISR